MREFVTYLAETALWEGELHTATCWLSQSLDYYADPRWNTIDQIERLYLAARLVVAQGDYQQGAILFGLADHVSRSIHYVPAEPVRWHIDVARATARAALGAPDFAEALAVGQRLSLDEAYTTILTSTAIASQISEIRHPDRRDPRR